MASKMYGGVCCRLPPMTDVFTVALLARVFATVSCYRRLLLVQTCTSASPISVSAFQVYVEYILFFEEEHFRGKCYSLLSGLCTQTQSSCKSRCQGLICGKISAEQPLAR